MSCDRCDEFKSNGAIAWVRVGTGFVGLIGCDEHLDEMLTMAREGRVRGPGRTWYRNFPKEGAKKEEVTDG